MSINKKDLLSDTPFVSVDLEVMENNIKWMSKLAKSSNVKLRPHIKTHKSPYIAKKQIGESAIGITTATLGEAEVMANAGIKDILIAFPIIGKRKLERLGKLLNTSDIIVGLDDLTVAEGINELGEYKKRIIPVYLDVDTGLKRMGRNPCDSLKSIIEISKLKYIDIIGLMSHAGHAYNANDEQEIKKIAIEDATLLYETAQSLKKIVGMNISEISVGTTTTAKFINEIPYITEFRPGTYVFNDRNVIETVNGNRSDCAVTVFSTVVSHPTPDRLIIDAGSKTLTSDQSKHGGYGVIKEHDNLIIERISEEHGIVKVIGQTSLRVGDVIEIIPNHVCPIINLTDEIYGFRNDKFERTIKIEGRGKNR